jgi:hypothetical protein
MDMLDIAAATLLVAALADLAQFLFTEKRLIDRTLRIVCAIGLASTGIMLRGRYHHMALLIAAMLLAVAAQGALLWIRRAEYLAARKDAPGDPEH